MAHFVRLQPLTDRTAMLSIDRVPKLWDPAEMLNTEEAQLAYLSSLKKTTRLPSLKLV